MSSYVDGYDPDGIDPDVAFLCFYDFYDLLYLLILLIYVDITNIYTCLTVEDECMHTAG